MQSSKTNEEPRLISSLRAKISFELVVVKATGKKWWISNMALLNAMINSVVSRVQQLNDDMAEVDFHDSQVTLLLPNIKENQLIEITISNYKVL